jgi:hypothetical protein
MEDTNKESKQKNELKPKKRKSSTIKKNESENDDAEFSLIRSQMHQIRGHIVMLDFDLAARYEVETKVLKQAVRRNIERFPSDFMFEITREEYQSLRSQIVTLETGGRGKYSKYQPFAFTELGVAMLSSVLNSEKAIKVNIDVMRAFVAIRQFLLSYAGIKQDFEDFKVEITDEMNARFKEVFNVLDELIRKKRELEKPRTPIGYKQNNENK